MPLWAENPGIPQPAVRSIHRRMNRPTASPKGTLVQRIDVAHPQRDLGGTGTASRDPETCDAVRRLDRVESDPDASSIDLDLLRTSGIGRYKHPRHPELLEEACTALNIFTEQIDLRARNVGRRCPGTVAGLIAMAGQPNVIAHGRESDTESLPRLERYD